MLVWEHPLTCSHLQQLTINTLHFSCIEAFFKTFPCVCKLVSKLRNTLWTTTKANSKKFSRFKLKLSHQLSSFSLSLFISVHLIYSNCRSIVLFFTCFFCFYSHWISFLKITRCLSYAISTCFYFFWEWMYNKPFPPVNRTLSNFIFSFVKSNLSSCGILESIYCELDDLKESLQFFCFVQMFYDKLNRSKISFLATLRSSTQLQLLFTLT